MIDFDRLKSRLVSPRVVLLAVAGLVATALLLHGLFVTSAAERNGQGQEIPPVTVGAAELRDVPIYVQAVGSVLANATVQIKSRIDGEILAVGFKEGQLVRKGDLLFQIDQAPYEAALRVAKANLQRDEAQLANAKLDLGRANKLVGKGYTSEQSRDASAAQVKALAGTVAADQAAVDQAQMQFDYAQIRAPIDGKTGAVLIDGGNIVRAADADPLVVLTQVQPVKISFALAQQNLPKLQERMKQKALAVSFKSQGDGAGEISVPVDFIANAVNAVAGTIELRATYDNDDLRLVPGEFVDVRVLIDELKDVVVVPRDAVNTGQGGLFVYVLAKGDTVEPRDVEVLYRGDAIAALAPGALKPGEKVVTDGQMRVAPGMPVRVVDRKAGA